MNREQITFLKSLDPQGNDGTIQALFLDGPDLTSVSFEAVARKLLTSLKAEKDYLVQDNIKLCNTINKGV